MGHTVIAQSDTGGKVDVGGGAGNQKMGGKQVQFHQGAGFAL